MKEEYIRMLPGKVLLSGIQSNNSLYLNNFKIPLATSLSVRNHSPTGFNWGYAGSGPAQSALGILLYYLPTGVALQYYQDFKFGFIATLPQGKDFEMEINLRDIMRRCTEKIK